jgi:hypothetical protein
MNLKAKLRAAAIALALTGVLGAGAPPIIRDLVDPSCPVWACGMNSNQVLLS